MDAFTWSLPFVASKILEMLLGVLAVCSEEELEASDEDLPGPMDASIPPHEKAARRQEIKNKIMAVGKMQRLYALLREEAEGVSELLPEGRMPPSADAAELPGSWPGGFSTAGSDALGSHVMDIRRKIRSFDDARHADSFNERLPQFTPSEVPIVPAPSMWVPRLAAASGGEEVDPTNMSMESYIRRLLADKVDDETAEVLAETISDKFGGRPKALKRFGTT
ncbi:hypothetical protein EIP86_000184 [Pleurotus ostreatoroseus]|nr:hypothetical protein EIP86_000184 [Pleurotus ostreatoroseus]